MYFGNDKVQGKTLPKYLITELLETLMINA